MLVMILSLCTTNVGYSAEDPRIMQQSLVEKSLRTSEQLYLKARSIAFDLQAQVKALAIEKETLTEEVNQLRREIGALRTENDKLRKECHSPEKEKVDKLKLEILEKKIDQLDRKINVDPLKGE